MRSEPRHHCHKETQDHAALRQAESNQLSRLALRGSQWDGMSQTLLCREGYAPPLHPGHTGVGSAERITEYALRAIRRVNSQDSRKARGSAAQQLLLPVGKPARKCRKTSDYPKGSHAAVTPITALSSQGPNSLKILDSDVKIQVCCSHSVCNQEMAALLSGISAHICASASSSCPSACLPSS